MKKTVYTLAVDGYAPEICAITFPLFEHFAQKIGGEFVAITERTLPPQWPCAMEKLQIGTLAHTRQDDWSFFFDADAMVCPDFFDPTEHVGKEVVLHGATDLSTLRFRSDRYFRRHPTFRSPGNWCTIASDWTRDAVWAWPDLSLSECVANITPQIAEADSEAHITAAHLVDDYVVARNCAKYGLTVDTIVALCARLGEPPRYLHHSYTETTEGKLKQMRDVLTMWKLA